MVSQTNEQALEDCIEAALVEGSRYEEGSTADFDREFALDREKFWRFLETTQAEELEKLSDRPNWQRLILERLDRKIKKDGILSVLKKGLSIDDAHLTLLYSLPYNDANPAILANFEKNIFSVTRQVHYSESDPGLSIDMVLFLNGMTIATLELKNPWTNQTVYHAKKQYKHDRDPREPLFQFARCIVHLAVDTDEVWMTTKLDRASTYFLPLNKGYNFGKGNPPNLQPDGTGGHKTAYLWEDLLTRQSLTNIIEHFAIIPGDARTPLQQKSLYFPRYHQLDVVRQLLTHAKTNGVGHTYLIQHSAGSGKSNSITWTAYQLIELYPLSSNAGRGVGGEGRPPDLPLFDSVVVVTDRRILDKQIRDNIRNFSQVGNIIAAATSSSELKTALETGKRIIITTIQKFPFIVAGVEDLSDRKFAIIIDEAHSSQSGQAADKMNMTLGSDDEEPEDIQDKILKAMEGRKLGKNVSYFAFTATPKNTTLEKFGQRNPDGKFVPFHLYSMKQAIEEGFILDVLANYTTYRSYYEIQKSIEDNPLFETAKAQRKLREKVEGDYKTIETKAEVMINHFIEQVWKPKKLKGQAKAMVVTQNIESAIRYFWAIQKILQRENVPFRAIVAFSGKKTIKGIEYTEDTLNNFPSRAAYGKDTPTDIPGWFKTEQYKILVVTAADRFNQNLGLEEAAKIDFKIKAKQFVKIYGQISCIIPYNNIRWEKLYWFLKFLIPKLIVRDPEQDQLDELLNSVDLSTYGLERVELNAAITLDDPESELAPQNPNLRGYRGDEPQQDPLDQIIAAFNDRFFSGWNATPQEQRVKFLNIARHVVQNPDFQNQVVNNQDEQNRRIALEQIIQQAINQERKRELDLYKRYASDPEFKRAFDASIMRLLAQTNQNQLDELLG